MRVNVGGELVSLVADVVTSAQMDPVEKKPLYHFLPGSKTFSVGSRRYRLYVKLWKLLFPVRKYIVKIRGKLGK